MSAAPKRIPTSAPAIACAVCGSGDWIRCDPGRGSDAEVYGASNVLPLFPALGDPAVAWCAAHDPMVVRS
jgi:hypothetical protein